MTEGVTKFHDPPTAKTVRIAAEGHPTPSRLCTAAVVDIDAQLSGRSQERLDLSRKRLLVPSPV